MDDSLYDEFGNYIGPELDSSDDEASQVSEEDNDDRMEEDDAQPQVCKPLLLVLGLF